MKCMRIISAPRCHRIASLSRGHEGGGHGGGSQTIICVVNPNCTHTVCMPIQELLDIRDEGYFSGRMCVKVY